PKHSQTLQRIKNNGSSAARQPARHCEATPPQRKSPTSSTKSAENGLSWREKATANGLTSRVVNWPKLTIDKQGYIQCFGVAKIGQ
ncbi:hypothetical protein, partial [Rhodoblastus sp.]|uniref:hypothetical protein n=1 Tax=Rhodoblastus sp. TaxID=1962975 RepID=UPI003F98EFAB